MAARALYLAVVFVSACLAALSIAAAPVLGDGLNFNLSATNNPQPFTIDVDPDFVNVTKLKASLYRPSRDLLQYPEWEDGPPQHNMSTIRDYWVQNYSWSDVEAGFNGQYNHFTTTTHAKENFTYPVPLHFVHHKSSRSDAIPILFLHGWPSSFIEWANLIGPLTNPANDSLPAFHVVAPDLPGFGFSPAPSYAGLGSREMGQAFDDLMHQLNYTKYTIYTTDLGTFVGRWMLYDAAASIVSHMTDFYFVQVNATDRERYATNQTSSEETALIAQIDYLTTMDFAYGTLHSTRPLSAAVPLSDTPVGFVGWIWQLMHMFSDGYPYTQEQLITDAMILFIQGVYGNVRSYKEFFQVSTKFADLALLMKGMVLFGVDFPANDLALGQ